MTINLHLPEKHESLRPTITVVGVGGAGGNAVNNMIASNLEGVNFIVANTDAQALDHSLTDRIIQLGAGITKGLGAGANPEVGRASAEEAREEIAALIEGSNMVFITAGMGGGTGTGAAPVVASIAKERGILTVGVVTKPFQFEGTHRMRLADAGIKALQEYVDTLIVIPNQNLFRIANERTSFADAFKMADEVLHSGVRGVTDLMVKPGLINLDFADIRTVMREMGKAMMGTGEASGEHRAIEAAEAAISNPLLDEVSLEGARALLINITGGPDMTLFEADEAANHIRSKVDPEANIIFGSTFNDAMEGRIRVSVVATGIDSASSQKTAPVQQQQPKFTSSEPKKPFAFAPTTPKAPEAQRPAAPAAKVMPAFDQPVVRAPVEQRAGGAARIERPAEAPQPMQQPQVEERGYEPMPRLPEFPAETPMAESPFEMRPVLREPASAATPQDIFEPRVIPVAAASRHERIEPQQQLERGFFRRMADVGRAAFRHDDMERQPTGEQRVQVVQKTMQSEQLEKAARHPDEDQYLDIPAFLRRQAN